jgi:uncharacterized protein DUF5947
MTPGLRRFVGAAPPPPPQAVEEHCEMCDALVPGEHGHVVDAQNRSLLCACRACFLLFTSSEAGGGRYRAVPDRYLHDPAHPITKLEWDSLGVPVGSAFFLRTGGSIAAFYPSPAGATECLLDLAAWDRLAADHPLLRAVEQDVEAVLVRTTEDGVLAYLVPIDVCYELVGTVRVHWQGFDGGAEAAALVAEFFAKIVDRARPVEED